MNIPNKILDALVIRIEDSKTLKEALLRVDNIQSKIRNANKAIDAAYNNYMKIKKQSTDEIIEYQKTCAHYVVKYHADASGGSDSCYVCEICGYTTRTPISKSL